MQDITRQGAGELCLLLTQGQLRLAVCVCGIEIIRFRILIVIILIAFKMIPLDLPAEHCMKFDRIAVQGVDLAVFSLLLVIRHDLIEHERTGIAGVHVAALRQILLPEKIAERLVIHKLHGHEKTYLILLVIDIGEQILGFIAVCGQYGLVH